MPEAKIQVKVGAIEFMGEGDEKWVSTQLDKILSKAAELMKLAPTKQPESGASDEGALSNTDTNIPLATFLKSKNTGNNQVKKFLATAIWLSGRGKKMLTTRDITKALSDNHQGKIVNASERLNQNIKKGFCEKEGREFYVTPAGFESMR